MNTKVKFSECVEYMIKGPFGSDMKKSLYVPKSSDAYKVYIQGNAIQQDETLGEYYVSEAYFHSKLERFEVHPGDYIITCDGTLGKFIKLSQGIEKGVISSSLLLLKLNENVIYDKYFELIWENQMLSYLASQARNACLIHLPSAKTIGDVEIDLPDLDVQREMAGKAFKIKAICRLRVNELRLLDDLIKARFVEMFGDPATNSMGWLETTIGKECFYIKDGPHKSLPDIGKENGGHPFISVRNIVGHTIDFSTAKYISDEDYIDARKKCCPEKGDMLYSKGGTTGIAKLIDVDIEFANWVHIAVLKFNRDEIDGVFFENMLNCDYCYSQSQKLTKGIANRDLVLSAMAQIKIYKPPIELQKEFAIFVQQVDKYKVIVQKSLDELQLLFDSLMQQYFG